MVGLMTQLGAEPPGSVSKASDETFYGTQIVRRKTCVTTVVIWHESLSFKSQ